MSKDSSHSASHIKHLGIIPDGARRWALKNGIPLRTAYDKTMERIASYIDLFFSTGVSSLSIYLASTDNIDRRNSNEVKSFIDSEYSLVTDFLPSLANKWLCRISIAGKISPITDAFRDAANKMSLKKEGDYSRNLYLLVGYDPIAELSYAIQQSNDKEIQLSSFWVPEYVDGIIRTAGEKRLSNFLPFQSGYAELYFISKLFMETSNQDMLEAYKDLVDRQQRHGK
jgi:undecaprenyl diphosphate synthase